jgi:hypothetical protein
MTTDKPLRRKRRVNPMSVEQRRPWVVDQISRRSWFRKQAAKRAAASEPPARPFGGRPKPETTSSQAIDEAPP